MIGTFEQYQKTATSVAQVAGNVLTQRPGTDPSAIRQWLLTKTAQGDVWLFAELDDQRIPKFEPYEQAAHHLSSSLRGMPVLISNHTGLRLAFLLSPVRTLPAKVHLPDELRPGRVLLGLRASGGPINSTWDHLGHILVAGMTGSGKSVTLRSLVYQAIRQECSLILGDLDNNTFPMLAGHPALLTNLAEHESDFLEDLRSGYREIEQRKALYSQAGNYPENLEDYNAWALKAGAQPLKRLVIALDEFNSAVENSGGANGPLANLAKQIVWRGRKFGVSLVMGSQDFSKEILGKIRDQVGVMIVHRVKDLAVAQTLGLSAAAKISANRPGRAMTDRWGLIQAYFVEKERLIQDGQVVELLSAAERRIAERAQSETDGKISLEVLMGWGLGQREARRLQDDWKLRGLAEIDPARKNGLYTTAKLAGLVDKLTNSTNLTNWPENANKLTNSPDKLTNSPDKLTNSIEEAE